jgi:hypothetical protein
VPKQTLHTDMEDAWAKYVFDETNPARFDALFLEALSYRLAADLAMPITRDPQYVKAMMNFYLLAISDAKTTDAREFQQIPLFGRSFIDARR